MVLKDKQVCIFWNGKEKKVLNLKQRTETQNSKHWRNGFPDSEYSDVVITVCECTIIIIGSLLIFAKACHSWVWNCSANQCLNRGQLNIVTACHTDQFAEWTRCWLLSGRRFNRGLSSAFVSHTNRHDSTSSYCWHKYPVIRIFPKLYKVDNIANKAYIGKTKWIHPKKLSQQGLNPWSLHLVFSLNL